MAVAVSGGRESAAVPLPVPAVESAALGATEVLSRLGSGTGGLAEGEAARRLEVVGPNAVRSYRARAWPVLLSQLRSPLLILLAVTALASAVLGQGSDAVIIGVILVASVGLGFANEYKAAKAAEALHSSIHHRCVVRRDGHLCNLDVTGLVPGDVVDLQLGQVVPADLRLLATAGLECDESVLTGESMPAEKSAEPVAAGTPLAELSDCALMGTVVRAGSGTGVVVATGGAAEFGRIALGLGERQPETEFQVGLRKFSMLLVRVAGVLTGAIFIINVALHKPVLDALLFSLAIAVGISPQLLPAVVSTSLAAGSRQLAKRKVLVKRLVCIEDLGDVDVLFTDKTGTLTEGSLRFMRSAGPDGTADEQPLLLGLLCNEAVVEDGQAVGGNPLDLALWDSPAAAGQQAALARYHRLATLPFDHERRLVSVLAEDDRGNRMVITKGAPEGLLERCTSVPAAARTALEGGVRGRQLGHRGRHEGSGPVLDHPGRRARTGGSAASWSSWIRRSQPRAPRWRGWPTSVSPSRSSPGTTRRWRPRSAPTWACRPGRWPPAPTSTRPAISSPACSPTPRSSPGSAPSTRPRSCARSGPPAPMSPSSATASTTPSRCTPPTSASRFDSATDVAKDAADVLLLEKDLDVLADGVMGGRQIFANTMKYVLMGTSSNFGNMFSAAGASIFLAFLPMLPSQILLNNLLYDTSQLAIPTDEVDPELVAQPTRWDLGFIRKFMLFFGPISSLFDFATFAIMLWGFHAGPVLFHTGWFVESLATQTLVIFVIRTRRIPFFRSRPSVPLLLAAFAVVATGAVLPFTPLGHLLGFRPLPGLFFLALAAIVVCYLVLIEIGKYWFYRTYRAPATPTPRHRTPGHRVHRRAARFTTHTLLPAPGRKPARHTPATPGSTAPAR